MTDFSPFSIPPRDLEAVPGIKPAISPSVKPPEGAPVFDDILKETLGHLSLGAREMEKVTAPSLEEAPQAMEAAKTAFAETMQAHQLMKELLANLQADEMKVQQDIIPNR